MSSKHDLLKKEGLTEDQITVKKDRIVENENGFISYRMEHGYPYITHVLCYPEKRKGWNWLSVFLKFKKEVMSQGHKAFIAEVIEGKEFFVKFLKIFGATRPYAKTENGQYYLIRFKE
jgi:hypothetical protein